jgi:hypothetical protein
MLEMEKHMDATTPSNPGADRDAADINGHSHDPITLTLLRQVLDDAWNFLPETRRQAFSKLDIASRILDRAAKGERDPVRLRTAALMRVVT